MKRDTIALKESIPADRVKAYEWLYFSDLPKVAYCHDCPEGTKPSLDQFTNAYANHFFDGSAPLKGRAYMISLAGTSEDVGFISYDAHHLRDGVAEIDVWMKSTSYTGHGLGSTAIKTLTDKLFEMGYHTIVYRPHRENAKAVKAGSKLGFSNGSYDFDSYYLPEHMTYAKEDSSFMILKKG